MYVYTALSLSLSLSLSLYIYIYIYTACGMPQNEIAPKRENCATQVRAYDDRA